MSTKYHPQCIVCKNPACRWDGGVVGYTVKEGRLVPGYIVYLCKTHDPGHNHFDLPDDLESAIGDLVALREELQEAHRQKAKIEAELLDLKKNSKV